MERIYVVALDRSGNVGVNASVRITEYPSGALATIYSDDGVTPKGNPFLTDENGSGFFYPANGRYKIEITGGGLDGIIREDVTAFDPADGAFESTQIAGLGDLSGQAQFEVLVSDGTKFQSTPLEDSIFDARYARVNATTEGYILAQSNRPGITAPLESDNIGAGRLAVFRQLGVDKAWITNAGGAEFSDDVVIQGDLFVNGTQTILNTQTLEVEDNIIILNSGVTGSPTLNAGLEVERGTSPNVYPILWDESIDRSRWGDTAGALHTIPGLDVADTWTAAQTFGDIIINGGGTGNASLRLDAAATFQNDIGFYSGGVLDGLLRWDSAIHAFQVADRSAGNNPMFDINPVSGFDFHSLPLVNPADPTGGTHVGDRDYNDARYGQLDVVNTWAQSQVISKAAGDTTLVIQADTTNSDEGAHPSIRLRQDGALTDWRIGLGYHDGDSASEWSNQLVITNVLGSGQKLGYSPDNGANVYEILHHGNLADSLLAGTNMTITDNGNGTVTFDAAGGGGGVTDHGALTGLADDDHTQYLRADGTRNVTGPMTFNDSGEAITMQGTAVGASNTVFMAFNDSAGTRQGYVGMGSSTNTDFNVHSAALLALSAAGNIVMVPAGGTVDVNGSLAIGGGAPIVKVLTATAVVNFASTIAGGQDTQTITVTGASVGDAVFIGRDGDSYYPIEAVVNAADSVRVSFTNYTASTIDLPSQTIRAVVVKF